MFDSERNKQHQRVLCKEIRRLPNQTIEQLAVTIETLVRKAYSLNTHDYKKKKMTKILMMTVTPQMQKNAIKKGASHPYSIREPDLDLRKLVDELEQAKITMILEETENLKLQYVNNIQTTTSQINNINDSDTELSENITEILNIFEENPNLKVNHHSKNGVIIADDTDRALPNADKNNKKIKKINHKNIENQINLFISTRKFTKIYRSKFTQQKIIVIIVQENHFQTTQIILDNNHLIIRIIEDDHQIKETNEISHNRKSHYRNNYSR